MTARERRQDARKQAGEAEALPRPAEGSPGHLAPEPEETVTLRLEERQIAQAKQIARRKSLSYQALMRSWISDGIAREERLRGRA